MPHEIHATQIESLSKTNIEINVLPHYNLHNASVKQIKIKNTDKQRAVYRVDAKDKTFCLKKVYYNEGDLLFVYSAMEWLYRNGINVPRFLPTLNRSRFVKYSDMLFILTPWVEGEKCNYDDVSNIIDSSRNLAKMHMVSKKFTPIPGSSIRKGYDDIYISTTKHFQKLLTCSNAAYIHKDKFSKLFLSNFDKNLQLAQLSIDVSSTINTNNLSPSLCHGDYVNKNIIFDDKGLLWVIDFDKCCYDYAAHDIGYFLRRLLKRDNTNWNIEIAVNCLKSYCEINPLTLDDLKYILVYLAFPQKYWRISKDYYNNIKKCNKNSFYKLLEKVMDKTDYHLQFIHELATYLKRDYGVKI